MRGENTRARVWEGRHTKFGHTTPAQRPSGPPSVRVIRDDREEEEEKGKTYNMIFATILPRLVYNVFMLNAITKRSSRVFFLFSFFLF